jgi:hypothetical protein
MQFKAVHAPTLRVTHLSVAAPTLDGETRSVV